VPTRQRIRLNQIGWEAGLEVESLDEPPPEPTGDRVLIAVEACGVCFRDLIDRTGRFPYIQLPVTPGHEAVGRVIAIGPAVTEWQVGDRIATLHRDSCGACDVCQRGETSLCLGAHHVFGLMADGGYASHLVAPQSAFYRTSESLGAAEAAVLHCTAGTAYRGLNKFGPIEPGQRVLVTGANGGVGCMAVHIASRFGAEVVAVVRSDEHEEFLTRLGATRVVVDPGTSFHRGLPGGRVDLALECVGAPTFNSALRSVRLGGGLVIIGNVVADRVELNLGYMVVNAIRMAGSSGATRADMATVLALHEKQPLKVPIHAELDLARADEAQHLVNAGGLRGRIALIP
jgi:D-arabinose 1-dehydrogenase-like Zn-dependent alcohol dehydrogenase